jgi:hypothetical protein
MHNIFEKSLNKEELILLKEEVIDCSPQGIKNNKNVYNVLPFLSCI